jgi:hypothetical protein
VKEYQDEDEKKLESSRKESFDKSTVLSDPVPQVPAEGDYYNDLTISEQQEFTKKLVEKMQGSEHVLQKI